MAIGGHSSELHHSAGGLAGGPGGYHERRTVGAPRHQRTADAAPAAGHGERHQAVAPGTVANLAPPSPPMHRPDRARASFAPAGGGGQPPAGPRRPRKPLPPKRPGRGY
jgi:hypothetical protein